MTTRIFWSTLVLAMLISAESSAQDWFWAASYQVSSPLSDTKDFAGGVSWRNVSIEGRAPIKPNVSAGLMVGWNVFNEEGDRLVSVGPADVSGYQFRYINAFPIMANVHYYFGAQRSTRLFVGANVGTYYIKQRLEIGLVAFEDDTWHLGFAPEVGVVIPLQWNTRAFLNARYHYAVKASDRTHQYFTFGVGFAWMN